MTGHTFDPLYDAPCSDLGAVAAQLHTTNDPETLRRLATGLWLDVFLLQLALRGVRGRYAELVAAARRATTAPSAPHLAALLRQLELAIDDPDAPVAYTVTDRAGSPLNGRRQ